MKKDMTVTTPWLSSHSHFPNKTQERRDNADTDEDFLREDRGNTVLCIKYLSNVNHERRGFSICHQQQHVYIGIKFQFGSKWRESLVSFGQVATDK